MPRNTNKAAASGKAAMPQISAKLFEELIPGPVTKEQFEDICQRRLNIDPPCRSNIDPGRVAGIRTSNCG